MDEVSNEIDFYMLGNKVCQQAPIALVTAILGVGVAFCFARGDTTDRWGPQPSDPGESRCPRKRLFHGTQAPARADMCSDAAEAEEWA